MILFLKKNSCDNLIALLTQSQINKPEIIELNNQGHILSEVNIFKIIEAWIYKKK